MNLTKTSIHLLGDKIRSIQICVKTTNVEETKTTSARLLGSWEFIIFRPHKFICVEGGGSPSAFFSQILPKIHKVI